VGILLAGFRGRLIAVTGRGGTGRSTLATALAQGLGADLRYSGTVCLADACLHGDQAVLHDARDVVPGVQELVEAHRSGNPSPERIRALTYDVPHRGYALLLGLRRHRDWTVVRPRAWEAALDGLCRSYRAVVADVDADVEGEAETGSFDIEDRNALARVAVGAADLVIAVGRSVVAIGPERLAGRCICDRRVIRIAWAAIRRTCHAHVAAVDAVSRPEATKAFEVKIDRTIANNAAARKGDSRFFLTTEERS